MHLFKSAKHTVNLGFICRYMVNAEAVLLYVDQVQLISIKKVPKFDAYSLLPICIFC